jgi:hypothetical protein
MSPYDSRSDVQRSIDQYVYVLMVAAGERNPVRRKALEADVTFALEAAVPYGKRLETVMQYDLSAADEQCDAAVEKVNAAIELLRRIGVGSELPPEIENPRTILAECAMTVIDTLRSLGAFDPEAVEILIDELFKSFDSEGVGRVVDRSLKTFIHRYCNDRIPEPLLDRIAIEEGFLSEYMKNLR